MSDFKLIAIRPRKGCDPKIMKVLKEDVIYQFYDNYIFKTKDDKLEEEVEKIIPNPDYNAPEQIYYISEPGRKPLPVNISAIVGKNGSGKSALSELLYLSIYNLSFALGIIKEDRAAEPPLIPAIVPDVIVEVYYAIGDDLYTLKIDQFLTDNCNPETTDQNDSFILKKNDTIILPSVGQKKNDVFKDLFPKGFFYTIAVNYSLYGLNSDQLGPWVRSLFHKNDGYQTPVVINPYREHGNIDINTENDLVYQRLLSNILELVDKNDLLNSLRNLANDKVATTLILKAREGYVRSKQERKAYEKKEYNIEIINEDEFVSTLFEKYTKEALAKFETNFFKEIVENYAQVKLRKICNRYDRYREFLPKYAYSNGDFPPNQYVELDKLVTTFLEDNSHVTFKLKQAFNFLAYNGLWHEWVDLQFGAVFLNTPESGAKFYYGEVPKTSIEFDIEEIADRITKAKALAKEKDILLTTIELLPLPFFEIGIGLDDGTNFEDLSSGEKQRCYSLSSIAYHITNLNSVFKNGKSHELKLLEYAYLNIFFDEVELYFHPEFQRTFINDLLKYIGRVSVANIDKIEGINMCFATHSPFILSDIPKSNILMLKVVDSGSSIPKLPSENTFAANIHELLSDSFFLSSSTGEFAKERINEILIFYDRVKNTKAGDLSKLKDEYSLKKDYFKKLTKNIGEEFIRGIINNHVDFIDEKLNK